MVICTELAVISKWTLVNIENCTVEDCKNWSTDMKFGTDVDKDVLILFLKSAKGNGHSYGHTGQFTVDTAIKLVSTINYIQRIEKIKLQACYLAQL